MKAPIRWLRYLGGDPTAFHGGQVSLNPLPHIRREPVGLVVVPILSYFVAHWMIGWASAPYNPSWQQRYPKRAAWMALAGPAANFALVILAAIAIHVGTSCGRIPDTRIGRLYAHRRSRHLGKCSLRGHFSQHPLRAESPTRHFQPLARSPSRWQYRRYAFHERRRGLAIPELDAKPGLWHGRLAARLGSL